MKPNCSRFRVQHSRVAIVKPKQKTADQALEEVEDAIRHNEGKPDPAAADLGESLHLQVLCFGF